MFWGDRCTGKPGSSSGRCRRGGDGEQSLRYSREDSATERARIQSWTRRAAEHGSGEPAQNRQARARADKDQKITMKGVILMAYGTPRSLEDVEAYYTHIRGGRKPSKAELANLVARYQVIGGTSPLIRITESQRDKLSNRLSHEGSNTRVYAAMKYSPPFIADVVARAAEEGVDELLAISLAPHYSSLSIGSYVRAVEEANATLPKRMSLDFVLSWHKTPRLIDAWTKRVSEAERSLPSGYSLVFSAHSLPERILVEGDPYKDELLETSSLIGEKLRKEVWSFAFQSASQTNEPWLGPDILDHLENLFAR